MANNIQVTAGSGTTLKTTDNAGVHTPHHNVDTMPSDPFGANADAASATGSISAKLRAIATALGATAFDLGTGTAGGRTLRVAIDSSQVSASVAHDAADSGDPLKIGGYAKAAAPSDVSGDGDRVNAWFLRNGAQTVALTAAGALIGGDAANGIDADITRLPGQEYETVAASQTAQVIGASGAAGDLINGILVIPATTSPGNVLLLDNAASITVFAGGGSSVSNLVPFFIPLGIKSVNGAWKITTGANVSCIAVGDFT
jgi:hypothetical protein